jgi:hypothetical protein
MGRYGMVDAPCCSTKPLRTPAEDVRYPWKSGKHLLELSFSHFVHALQRLTAAETTKNWPLRDFRSHSMFDFFDSIDPTETLTNVSMP